MNMNASIQPNGDGAIRIEGLKMAWGENAHKRARIFLSRLANILTGGSRHELFCTRALRNGWRITRLIDAIDVVCGNPPHHCRRSYVWDVRVNGRPT